MVKGVGVDLVEIRRVEKIYRRFPQRFLNRLFTPAEIWELEGRGLPSLAARFAAKEAVAKALGTGIGPIGWKDIVLLQKTGPPVVHLLGKGDAWARGRGIKGVMVSWSHEGSFALAQAVAYGSE